MKQIPSPDRTKIRLNSTTTSSANSLESPHSKFSSSINDDSIIELREQVFHGLAFSKIPDKKLRLLIIHLKQYIKHEVSIGNDFNAKLGEMKLRSLRKELKFRQNPASAKDKEEDIYQKEWTTELELFDKETKMLFEELQEIHEKEIHDLRPRKVRNKNEIERLKIGEEFSEAQKNLYEWHFVEMKQLREKRQEERQKILNKQSKLLINIDRYTMNSNTIEFKNNFKSHRKVPPLSKYLPKRTPPKTLEYFKASRKNSPKKTEKPLTPRRRVDHVKNLLNSSKKNKKNKTYPKKETQNFKFSIELDEKANNKHKKGQIQDMKQIEIEKKEENESIIQINDQKFSENQEANEEIMENDEETIKIIIDDDEINFKIKKKFKKPYICDRKHIQINDFKVTDHNEIEFKDYGGTKSLSTNVEIPFYDLVFTCESEEEMNEIPHQELVYNCESEEEVNEIDYYEFALSCESEEENEQYLSDEKIKLRFYTRRYYCESEEDIPDEYHVRNIRRSKSEEFILYHERRINCESEEEINEIPHEELTYYCESEEDIPDEMTIIQMKESQKLKELLFFERRYNCESEEDENEIELMNADNKLKRIYFEELRINCESEEDDNEVFHDDYKYQCESEEDLMDSSYEDEFDQLDILKFHRIQYKTHRKCESEEEINEDEFYADDESSLNEEIRLSDHAPIINEIDGFEAFEILDTNTSDSQEEEDEKDDKYLHEIKEIEDKEKSESITINNFILPDSIEINNTHHNLEFDHKDQINQNISDESYTNMESSLYYSTSEYNDYYTSETNTYNAYDDYSSIYNSDTSSNNDSFNDSQSDFGNDQSSHRINVSKALHEAMRLKFSQPKIQVKSNKPIISPRRLLQQSSGSETPSMSISIKKKPKSTNSPVTSPTTDKIVYSKHKAKIQIKQQLKEEVLTSRLHFVQNESPRRSPFTVNSNIRTQSNMDQKIKKVGDFLNPSNVRWLK